jgi:hypothetical protein
LVQLAARDATRHDLAGHQPIEQMTDRCEPLLDARRREVARADLDPGGDGTG